MNYSNRCQIYCHQITYNFWHEDVEDFDEELRERLDQQAKYQIKQMLKQEMCCGELQGSTDAYIGKTFSDCTYISGSWEIESS